MGYWDSKFWVLTIESKWYIWFSISSFFSESEHWSQWPEEFPDMNAKTEPFIYFSYDESNLCSSTLYVQGVQSGSSICL